MSKESCAEYSFRRSGHALTLAALAACAALCACSYSSNDDDSTDKINGSVHVAAGKPRQAVGTINGDVRLDDNAAVTAAATVNGSVHLGAHATAASVKTVNGSVTLETGAKVAGSAATVNGSVSLRDGSEVAGALSNVNGSIQLDAAHVAGGINTVNGNINVNANSHVEGGILVQKSTGFFIHFGSDVPRIVIGPGAVVQGELRFEREVQLYVSDRATIGTVSGATPIPFSGDKPPA
jgi:cytoskeletal protein CcmA (bactofilin family)